MTCMNWYFVLRLSMNYEILFAVHTNNVAQDTVSDHSCFCVVPHSFMKVSMIILTGVFLCSQDVL